MLRLAKILITLLIVSIILPVLPVEAQGNAIMRLTSVKTDYLVGETVYIDIMVEPNGEILNTVRAIMDFTSGDVLLINDFNLGTAFPYQSPGQDLDNINNSINIGGFILVDIVTTDSLFGTLIFRANQAGSSTITFVVGSHLISPDQQEKINLAGSQGITINVSEPPPPPNRMPIFQPVSNKSIDLGQSVNFEVSATDTDGDNVDLTWDIPAGATFSNVTSGITARGDFSWTPTSQGAFTLYFYAADDHPTDSKTAVLSVGINVSVPAPPANRAPVFQAESNKSIDLGQSVNFQVLATDPDADNITLTWDIPVGAFFNNVTSGQTATGNLSWTPVSQGTFTLYFYATDDHPSDPKSTTLSIRIDVSVPPPVINRAPVFKSVSNKSINLGDAVNFQVSATDPDGDIVTLTWDIPAGASFSNVTSGVTARGDFSWTPLNEGVFTIIFYATDDNLEDPESSTLNVSIAVTVLPPPPNNAPEFDPITEQTVNAGETLVFNITATDPDNDNVTLSMLEFETASLDIVTTGPTSTARFTWQPQNFGIYYVLFDVVDDHATNPLSKSLGVRITVFGGKCPPCGGGGCPVASCDEIIYPTPIPDMLPPVISSPSHPSQDKWYLNNEPQFIWQASQEGLGYTFNLDKNPLSDPAFAYFFSDDNLFSFSQVEDGFWYFHVKVKYDDGWGPTAHYQVKIDTSPPEFFKPYIDTEILTSAEKQYNLYFSAIDQHSGVAYYEMKIDDNDWEKVTNPLVLNELNKQGKNLTLRVIDKVGNVIESYIDLKEYVVIDKEPLEYTLEEEIAVLLDSPIIDKVLIPSKIGKIIVRNVLVVTGRAVPNSIVHLHLSTIPETIIKTLSDENGLWLAYSEKDLDAGRYSLYALAQLADEFSLPSEMVHFTLTEKFTATSELAFPWLWIVIILILVVITLLILKHKLKHKLKEIIKKKKEIFKKNQDYEKNNKNNQNNNF